ncbi:MAG: Holliday junction branch migration protein RuvA [Lentisphaeria bacterium]
MIARITGVLLESSLTEVVIDVHGIAYALTVPLSTVDKLPALQQAISLHTHLHVREDALQLFGFFSRDELNLFRILLNAVPGIGPKLALSVLSSLSINAFCNAVAANDLKTLSKINGVGKKTAERMVIELRDKVGQFSSSESVALAGSSKLSPEAADAVAALETLGFKREAGVKAVQKLSSEAPPSGYSASELIRKALAQLNS